MDPISPDELFFSLPDTGSPGAEVHLYRLLHLLATQGATDSNARPVSYAGAKKIAGRLNIDSPERLTRLFRYMGFGELSLEIQPGLVSASVAGAGLTDSFAGFESAAPDAESRHRHRRHLCEFQRGLIDGALERITGLPVTTSESECCAQGGIACIFEAVRNERGGGGYTPANSGGAGWAAAGLASSTAQGMRTWFMELAGRELARAKRHHRRLSLLYVDIDDLGEVNTSHGRQAGDELISATGNAISRTCRAEDFLWHHGEDEFAIVLTETDAVTAARVAERLAVQIRMAAELIDVSSSLSACIGIATYPDNGETVLELFRNAKSALYLAKAAGKGEVHGAGAIAGGALSGLESGNAGAARETENRIVGATGPASGPAPARDDLEEARKRFRSEGGTGELASSGKDQSGAGCAGNAERGYTVALGSTSHLVLAGMKHELEREGDIYVAGEFTRAGSLLTFVEDIRPDVVLIDVQTAVADDFALPRFIEGHNLPSKLVIIIENADADVIKLAADFKVEGMVMQSTSPAELVSALDTVHEGRIVMPERIRTILSELESSRRVLGELSDRELEVLRLVADGKSNSQISEELFITVNTVRFHLANIYQKLSVSNRTEAANYFLRQDMPPEEQARLL